METPAHNTADTRNAGPATARAASGVPRWAWLALLMIIALAALLRARQLAMPLDRDEAEYALAGRMILEGVPPYAQMANMKLPGAYVAYAAILAAFGDSTQGVRLGLIAVNAASIAFVFLLARALVRPWTLGVGTSSDRGQAVPRVSADTEQTAPSRSRLVQTPIDMACVSGVAAAGAFAILSLGQAVQGLSANAEHFVLLPALAGLWIIASASESSRLWRPLLAGVLMGCAFIVKQHAVLMLLLGAIWVFDVAMRAAGKRVISWLIAYSLGALCVPVITVAVFAALGLLDKLWYWTVLYAWQYVATAPPGVGMKYLRWHIELLVTGSPVFVVLAAVGLVASLASHSHRRVGLLLNTWLLAAAVCTMPGMLFRLHYFLFVTPVLAVASGVGVAFIARKVPPHAARRALAALIVIAMGITLVCERTMLFSTPPALIPRLLFDGPQPFYESIEIGRWIREHTAEDESIAVMGSEPQIYVHAHRRAATGVFYMYPLMENHPLANNMQRSLIARVTKAKPRVIVLVPLPDSWGRGPWSDPTLFKWLDPYLNANYRSVGLIDMISDTQIDYRWGEGAARSPPKSPSYVQVFIRNDTPPLPPYTSQR